MDAQNIAARMCAFAAHVTFNLASCIQVLIFLKVLLIGGKANISEVGFTETFVVKRSWKPTSLDCADGDARLLFNSRYR